MLGRGALARPDLARQIKAAMSGIAEISDAFKQHRMNDLSGLEDPGALENKISLKNKSSSEKDDSIIVAGGVVNGVAKASVLHR